MYIGIILLVIAICYPFIFKYIEQYLLQKGKNAAQKEDIRDIQYESKKGENLATKEDIKEITEQIETVKNEVSFENQRKHEFIKERTERLLKILCLTEKLNEYEDLLFYTLYDIHSSEHLISIVENINKTLLTLVHECRIAFVTNDDKNLKLQIEQLKIHSQPYAAFMCRIASNALSLYSDRKDFLELAQKNENADLLNKAIECQSKAEQVRKEFEDNIKDQKKPLYEAQMDYLSKLNSFFGSKFNLKGHN